jgi:hypothetical protein
MPNKSHLLVRKVEEDGNGRLQVISLLQASTAIISFKTSRYLELQNVLSILEAFWKVSMYRLGSKAEIWSKIRNKSSL